MPKVTKLKIVDIIHEAEEMSLIEQEMRDQPNTEQTEEPEPIVDPIVEEFEPVVMKTRKPRVKVKAKAKAQVEEVEEIVDSYIIEPPGLPEPVIPVQVVEVVQPLTIITKIKKIPLAKVNCPKCNRSITERGLQYSHKCPVDNYIRVEQPPVQIIERIIERPVQLLPDYNNIPAEIMEQAVTQRLNLKANERITKHHENMARLALDIY